MHLRLAMRVACLTPVTHSPSFLPTFEDAQITVRRPLVCHFWQVIYMGDYSSIRSLMSL